MTAAVARTVIPQPPRSNSNVNDMDVIGLLPFDTPQYSTRRMLSRSMSADSSINYTGAFKTATLYNCDKDFEIVPRNNISDKQNTTSKRNDTDTMAMDSPEDPKVRTASTTCPIVLTDNDSSDIQDFVVVQMSDLETTQSEAVDLQSVVSDEDGSSIDTDSYVIVEDSNKMSMEEATVTVAAISDKKCTFNKATAKKKKEQGRKKKWKPAAIITCGFQISVAPSRRDADITEEMENELQIFEGLCEGTKANASNIKASVNDTKAEAITQVQPEKFSLKVSPDKSVNPWNDGWDYEGAMERRIDCLCSANKALRNTVEAFSGSLPYAAKRLRRKKKWSTPKAHKQIQTKHCYDVSNQYHGTTLYINHRVSKRMIMGIGNYMIPVKQSIRQLDKRCHINNIKSVLRETVRAPNTPKPENRGNTAPRTRAPRNRPPPAHALTAYNADGELQPDLVNVLLSLQDRDLTPEDYETLLRLDERVQVKTIDVKTIEALKTDTVSESTEGDICAICIGEYLVGMTRKHLPCGHYFHKECLVEWLNNSTTCPLDGLEVPT